MLNTSTNSSDSSQYYSDDCRTAAAATTAACVPSLLSRRRLFENMSSQNFPTTSMREIRTATRNRPHVDDGSVNSYGRHFQSVREIRAEREMIRQDRPIDQLGGNPDGDRRARGGPLLTVSTLPPSGQSLRAGRAEMPPRGLGRESGSGADADAVPDVIPDEQDRKRILGCLACILGNRPHLADAADNENHAGGPGVESGDYDRSTPRSCHRVPVETDDWVSDDEEDGSLVVDFPSFSDDEDASRSYDKLSKSSYIPERLNTSIHSSSSLLRTASSSSVNSHSFPPTTPRGHPRKKYEGSAWRLCHERHTRRYHEFNTNVLQRCTALLMLDPSNARAFAPLLSMRGTNPRQHEEPHGSRFGTGSIGGESGSTMPMQHRPTTSGLCSSSFHRSSSSECETPRLDAGSEFTAGRGKASVISTGSQTHVSGASFALPPDIFVPFLRELSPGSGYRCVAMLLLKYLLTSKEGYDARVRHVFKRLAVEVFSHEIRTERSFSSMMMSNTKSSKKDKLIRAAKIGSVGVLAGTLFAVSGGIAAPVILSGIGAFGASAGAVTFLTSWGAVSTIFGVGGGGLAVYKMKRRTAGLTQFDFTKETNGSELFSIICLSGWLRDEYDFQRPWGVKPQGLPILELLQRFYSVHKPENVPRCVRILQNWKGDEKGLWNELRKKYGRDPSTLLPLAGPRQKFNLTFEQDEILNNLLVSFGFSQLKPREAAEEAFDQQPSPIPSTRSQHSTTSIFSNRSTLSGVLSCAGSSIVSGTTQERPKNASLPKHVVPVWDFGSQYGGELYSVKWESKLLLELRDCVTGVAVELATGATRQILYQTALHSLMATIALPYALVSAAHMIDGTWTLAIERADEAGVVLAQSLLRSKAGHRPITLVGFSMGARMIYSCLKELAKHQAIWGELQAEGSKSNVTSSLSKKKTKSLRKIMNNSSKIRTNESNDAAANIYPREPASIVEDAILMGCPNHLSQNSWKSCRQVVAGRLVNCYASTDLILTYLFQYRRMSGIFRPVCGTNPIDVQGVENFDVSDFISSHMDYCSVAKNILEFVKFGRPDMAKDPLGFEIETHESVEVASSIGPG
mmetsp:Transcript_8760/g.17949  ORF Transcript_8760/g.17949 Transcript_8760/m.17949 type:complete len:1081 (+) Transcript_8760:104-3346(+)